MISGWITARPTHVVGCLRLGCEVREACMRSEFFEGENPPFKRGWFNLSETSSGRDCRQFLEDEKD